MQLWKEVKSNPKQPSWKKVCGAEDKFTRIVIIKTFAISLSSQPFLGRQLGFHIFFHNGLLQGHTLFFTAGLDCSLPDLFYRVVIKTLSQQSQYTVILFIEEPT